MEAGYISTEQDSWIFDDFFTYMEITDDYLAKEIWIPFSICDHFVIDHMHLSFWWIKCLEMGETQFLPFIGTFQKCLEMGETQFLLFIGTFEKCLEMGETQFFLFIGTFERCLEMGEEKYNFSYL